MENYSLTSILGKIASNSGNPSFTRTPIGQGHKCESLFYYARTTAICRQQRKYCPGLQRRVVVFVNAISLAAL